jgi:ATP-dependent DNA helicase RecG
MNLFLPDNPLIAEVCYRVGYIDSWGRGIEKITDACKQAGLPDPIIVERTGGIAVELMKSQASAEMISESGGNDFGTISERIRKEFGMEPAKAFEIICRRPDFTAEQIAAELGKTPRTVENYLAKLKKAGVVTRKGPKLGGYWEVKD